MVLQALRPVDRCANDGAACIVRLVAASRATEGGMDAIDEIEIVGPDEAVHEAPEPFPRDRAAEIIRRLPSYARLGWNIGRDPKLSRSRRGVLMAAAAYVVSPIDAVPGIIPVIGQLDDLLVLVAAITWALASMPAERRERHLADVGLSASDIADDLDALRGMGTWAVRRTVRGALGLARTVRSGAARSRGRVRDRMGRAYATVRSGRGGDAATDGSPEPGPD